MKSLNLYFVTNLFAVCLFFSCPAGGWNPLSVHSRWCMTTWQLWAMQTLYVCSKKQPTPTSAVWFVSTAVSAQPHWRSLPVFIVRCCSVSSGPSPLKTDLKVWKQAAAGFQILSSCFHLVLVRVICMHFFFLLLIRASWWGPSSIMWCGLLLATLTCCCQMLSHSFDLCWDLPRHVGGWSRLF